ncbi:MAG: hypothetical protein HRU30_20585 [Rhodobacteraceae bacterium]|nr:hypothetical protein [Paracoccaceae bacterium]
MTGKYDTHRGQLLAAITHLGGNPVYWARSAAGLANETALDEAALTQILKTFDAIFRPHTTSEGKTLYSLHLRYAFRTNQATTDAALTAADVPPLDTAQLEVLLNWVSASAAREAELAAQATTNRTALIAAGLAALAAIAAAGVAIFAQPETSPIFEPRIELVLPNQSPPLPEN